MSTEEEDAIRQIIHDAREDQQRCAGGGLDSRIILAGMFNRVINRLERIVPPKDDKPLDEILAEFRASTPTVSGDVK